MSSVCYIHQKPKVQNFLFSLRVHAQILAVRNLQAAKLKNGGQIFSELRCQPIVKLAFRKNRV